MKVYILGKMTGVPQFNFPAFDEARDRLNSFGKYQVVSPVDKDREAGFDPSKLPANYDWSKFPDEFLNQPSVIRKDLELIQAVDCYVALDGWETSKGARAEKAVADWRGIPRIDWKTGERWTEDTSTNPKDICGKKKPTLHLVPPALMIFVAKVMELGARKYGPYNWRLKRVQRTVYLSAAMRHLQQSLDGEDSDSETGQPHEASAAACMGIILDAQACGCLIDDRPPKGAASRLIAELTEKS